MMSRKFQLAILLSLGFLLNYAAYVGASTNEEELSKFLDEVNERLAFLYNQEVIANWQNEINGPNDLIALLQSEIATQEIMRYIKSISTKVAKFKRLHVKNETLERQLNLIPKAGYEALPREDLELMYAVTANMSDIYRNAKLCSFTNRTRCDLRLIPDVQNILHSSKSIEEIEYYWLEWRRRTGIAAKSDFAIFVELYQKTAKLNGFTKPSDFWYKDLDENSSETSRLLKGFMHELQPLFLQFHGYVRGQLRKEHGERLVAFRKPYPQNLAEIFIGNAYREVDPDFVVDLPYNGVGLPDITKGLLKRGLSNAQRNFWNVAEFFRSLGMPQLEDDFWSDSAKPKADLEDEYCWHKAWKYYGLHQVNFSYCPVVNEFTFYNMFEAVSDVYYYRAYESQVTVFQDEPIPNFSDALGKFFSLAASSVRYLEKLKVVDRSFSGKEARINKLYLQGLRTVFLLPVFYVLERYRTGVIDKHINIDDNCAYWQLTEDYTGAEPPVQRSNKDFDAPAKLLMEVDDQYTSQMMSIVLQFQLYEHFCSLTGQYRKNDANRPLDLCDLSGQRAVGSSVFNGMSLGASKSYKEILLQMTNQTELSMKGLLAYFQPLYDWLVVQNQLENNEIGWQNSEKCVS